MRADASALSALIQKPPAGQGEVGDFSFQAGGPSQMDTFDRSRC
jgi:hypothetical protein